MCCNVRIMNWPRAGCAWSAPVFLTPPCSPCSPCLLTSASLLSRFQIALACSGVAEDLVGAHEEDKLLLCDPGVALGGLGAVWVQELGPCPKCLFDVLFRGGVWDAEHIKATKFGVGPGRRGGAQEPGAAGRRMWGVATQSRSKQVSCGAEEQHGGGWYRKRCDCARS